MAMLVAAARRHHVLTYTDVALRLGDEMKTVVSPRHVGAVVDVVINRVTEIDRAAPPINALVVSKAKKIPGSGADQYIRRYLKNGLYEALNDEQKRAALLPVFDAIYNFPSWERIAHSAFEGFVPEPDFEADLGESDGKTARLGFGGPAESPEHRRLKEFVAENPRLFGAPNGSARGEVERRLKTCDEIDVWFVGGSEQLAVEVKSIRSNDLDIQRGIFQCVKYQAVLEAELTVARASSKVRSRLVSERKLNPEHLKWAQQLDVEVQVLKQRR